MEDEFKTNEETAAVEGSQSADMGDSFKGLDLTSAPEPTETSEPTLTTAPAIEPLPTEGYQSFETVKPQSFDMVTPVASPEPVTTTESIIAKPSTEEVKPVEESKTIEVQKVAKTHNGHFWRNLLFVIIILILIGGAAAGAYFYRDKVASDLEKQQSDNIATLQLSVKTLGAEIATDKTTSTAVTPSASVIASIKATITSGNTAALAGYMESSVNIATSASGGNSTGTAAQAVTSVSSFITGATSPWDFALTSSVLSSYSAGAYKQYFPSIAIVGESANSKVISFNFDSNAKISTVFMSATDSLLK